MKFTFKDFQKEFPDDAACLERIMREKFGGTEITCPGCGVETKFHRIAKRRAYACQECGHHVYPCAGTIFEKSRTPLTNWFFTMYLMTSTRHGVAAKEVERQLGCTYKTAWRMCHELRKLMAKADTRFPMHGHVEVDETLIGGRQSRHEYTTKGKPIVMGIVQRDGPIRCGPIPDTTTRVLSGLVRRNVQRGSIISTDERRGYNDLAKSPYTHGRVNHQAKQWTNGIHHTNTIEGHWSQLKRSIKGTHVHVSPQHLWKYVSEFSYRRNKRHSHREMFTCLLEAFALPRPAKS